MKEFRIWHTENTEYVNKSELDDYYLGADGGVCYYNRMTESMMELEYCTAEFWTGKTDSEGAKIFHADKINDHVGEGIVIWCPSNCSYKVGYIGENVGIAKWFIDYYDREWASFKVIGTVHQDEK